MTIFVELFFFCYIIRVRKVIFLLTFFDTDDVKGAASIYEGHITFNKVLLRYLENIYRVRVGADSDEGKIYVFLYDKDKALNGEVKESSLLALSISKTYARICSRGLVDYIKRIFKLEIPAKSFLRYRAYYDEVKRAIVIDIEEDI